MFSLKEFEYLKEMQANGKLESDISCQIKAHMIIKNSGLEYGLFLHKNMRVGRLMFTDCFNHTFEISCYPYSYYEDNVKHVTFWNPNCILSSKDKVNQLLLIK